MLRKRFLFLVVSVILPVSFILKLSTHAQTQEWHIERPRGILKVVDLGPSDVSVSVMYSDFLIAKNRDNEFVPSLAENWRWLDDRTIEFKLRRGVLFHNGEELNAQAVKTNFEAYMKMKSPNPPPSYNLPKGTVLEILEKFRVRFTLPEPNGLTYMQFWCFDLFAPAFFAEYSFREYNWSQLDEPGPWGAGPFILVEGGMRYTRAGKRIVLEAFEDYWDPRYPKVKQVIYENRYLADRKEAMRLCREKEGFVDIVSRIRPLDTLKVAESPFGTVIKSKDLKWVYGLFNQRKKDSKWGDIKLREALNYAIN
jgi:peptide/nickel transport system substrate-binding protein